MFDYSFVISLKNRPERLKAFQERALAAGIDGIRPFQAFTAPPNFHGIYPLTARGLGAFGCTLSHQAILSMANAMAFPHVAIFEDDAEFCDGFKDKAQELYTRLPCEWDIFFVGSLRLLGQQYLDEGLARGTNTWGTHCYIVNGTSFQKVLDVVTRYKNPLDEELSMSKDLKCIYAMPSLSCQLDIPNDIDGKKSPKWNTTPDLVFLKQREEKLKGI